MFPAASASGVAIKTGQPVSLQATQTSIRPQAPEAARSSAGEPAAANVKAETTKAVAAPDQTAVAPRLRDQENLERTERPAQLVDAPTGPPPAFEESPLERQARVAFEPPEIPSDAPEAKEPTPEASSESDESSKPMALEKLEEAPQQEPPPTRTERAEASFAETKSLSETREPATLDLAK